MYIVLAKQLFYSFDDFFVTNIIAFLRKNIGEHPCQEWKLLLSCQGKSLTGILPES
jgi:hypothetical protein